MTPNTNNHLVIMAGGVGSRFWPLSSEDLPKQFLDVLGCGKTLIQLTLERFQGKRVGGNLCRLSRHHTAPAPPSAGREYPLRALPPQHCPLHLLCVMEDKEAQPKGKRCSVAQRPRSARR